MAFSTGMEKTPLSVKLTLLTFSIFIHIITLTANAYIFQLCWNEVTPLFYRGIPNLTTWDALMLLVMLSTIGSALKSVKMRK